MSIIGNPITPAGGKGGYYPSLRVSAPTGSTVTATNGTDTVTLTEIEGGVFWGEVPDYGTWTVSGVLGEKNGSAAVEVVDVAMVEVELVVLPPIGKALDDYTWEEISEISEAEKGPLYFSVGDTKAVELSGTCGTLSLDTVLYCYILGFDHNETYEGKGIHFGTWKDSSGKDICLVDSKHNANAGNTGYKYYAMNHWGNASSSPYNTNYGGWKGCDGRYDILGSTDKQPSDYGKQHTTSCVGYDASTTTATSPVANTLMSCLPAALRAVMKPMTKYTDNYGNSSNVADHVTTSVDYLPLLAEWEIFGARTDANLYEQNSQAQYEYYRAGNSRVKYRHSATGSTAFWWERSPDYGDAYRFCYVYTNNTASHDRSHFSNGLAPVFKV